MSTTETTVRQLDAAYAPFPNFAEFNAATSLDLSRWDRYQSELATERQQHPDVLKRAFDIATRAAALDTGAIEGLYDVDRGFTYTVAMETTAWEASLLQRGEKVRPLFDAQLAAYEYVLSLATTGEPLSEAAVRELHKTVCAAQDTYTVQTAAGPQQQDLPKGVYKLSPNHVRTRTGEDHPYAPVEMTPPEMQRLFEQFRTQRFLATHPIIQAAYAHYGLVVIHPFADGNGRVARALASAFTYKAAYMPVVILSEYKAIYFDSLADADAGNYQSFVEFMLARTLDTMQLILESIRSANKPSVDDVGAKFKRFYLTKGGYTHDQVDQWGAQLTKLVMDECNQVVAKAALPRVQVVANNGSASSAPSTTHRPPMNATNALVLRFTSQAPAAATVQLIYFLWIPRDAASSDNIQLREAGGRDMLEARVDELFPTISGLLMMRIKMFSARIIADGLQKLSDDAAKSFGR